MPIDHLTGISLTDTIRETDNERPYLEVQVCKPCWSRIPIVQRVWLNAILKTRLQGGASVAEVFGEFAELVTKTLQGGETTRQFDDLTGFQAWKEN